MYIYGNFLPLAEEKVCYTKGLSLLQGQCIMGWNIFLISLHGKASRRTLNHFLNLRLCFVNKARHRTFLECLWLPQKWYYINSYPQLICTRFLKNQVRQTGFQNRLKIQFVSFQTRFFKYQVQINKEIVCIVLL